MSWQQIKRLNEERGQHLADMKAMLKTAEDEKRDLTTEEDVKFNELNTAAESKKSQAERYQKASDLERSITSTSTDKRHLVGRDDINTTEQRNEQEQNETRAAIDKYLRTGQIETRAITVSGAGVVGDRPIYNQLVTAIKTFAGVRQAGATILPTTDGNDLSVPTSDDTSNTGQIVGEATTDNTEAEPTVGNIALKAYKFDSKWIKVSLEMLQDAAYPLESYILGIAGERIGRAFNTFATTGTGTGQPKGFLVAGTAGTTAAANDEFTYDELVDFYHSIDAGYRNSPNFGFQFHDTTLAAIRKLKDGNGRYIFVAGSAGAPSTILDTKYTVNNSMPQLTDGVNSKVVAAGDWSRYFVRDVTQAIILRADELFAGDGLVGYRVWQRMDGNLTDLNAVKYMKLAAS